MLENETELMVFYIPQGSLWHNAVLFISESKIYRTKLGNQWFLLRFLAQVTDVTFLGHDGTDYKQCKIQRHVRD